MRGRASSARRRCCGRRGNLGLLFSGQAGWGRFLLPHPIYLNRKSPHLLTRYCHAAHNNGVLSIGPGLVAAQVVVVLSGRSLGASGPPKTRSFLRPQLRLRRAAQTIHCTRHCDDWHDSTGLSGRERLAVGRRRLLGWWWPHFRGQSTALTAVPSFPYDCRIFQNVQL